MAVTANGETMSNPEGSTDAPAAPADQPKMNPRDRWFMILLTVFEIGASILIVQYVKDHGGSDFAAYMWSLLPPVIGGLIYWARTRHASGASAAILAFNLLSAAVAFFGSHDSKVLLYKDCAVTGIIGVLFAASLLMPRPLTFWFGQRFATDGTPASLAWWDGLWQYPQFRHLQRLINVIWAVIMIFEAGLKAFTIAHTSFKNGYMATQVIPIAATVIGVTLTMMLAKRGAETGRRSAAMRSESA